MNEFIEFHYQNLAFQISLNFRHPNLGIQLFDDRLKLGFLKLD